MNSACIACNTEYEYSGHDYVQCGFCRSWNLAPLVNSAVANKEFYDDVYNELPSLRRNRFKKKIFNFFQKYDEIRRRDDYKNWRFYYDKLPIFDHSNQRILEIGFGPGRTLVRMLAAGKDAYGMDISETAVKQFKQNYPQYADRVSVSNRYAQNVDIVYCSALFEHLDNPVDFIRQASQSLVENGLLIIDALPCVNPVDSNMETHVDINFWKPLHRAIYSTAGLSDLMSRNGFVLERYACLDVYNNRVLSLHLDAGYQRIVRIRNSTMTSEGLPDTGHFARICWNAVRVCSLAANGCFTFRKKIG